MRALLSGSVAAPVDALRPLSRPSSSGGAMAADPGGGSSRWLARAMQELGYSCSASEAAFKNLLRASPGGRLDEAAVAEALGLMARTVRGLDGGADGPGLAATLAAVLADGGAPAAPLGEPGAATWNVGAVVDALKARAPGLSWGRVAEALDHDGFLVPEPAGLGVLTAAFRRATGESLPLAALVGRPWANAAGQLSLLAAATVAPPDAVPWDASARRVAPLEGLAGGSPTGTPSGCWLSVDLLAALCQLGDAAGQAAPVRRLLEAPLKACPEVLLCNLGALRPPGDADWGATERWLWGALLPQQLAGAGPNSALVLRRLFDANPAALLKGAGLWAGGDAARVGRVLDLVARQLGAPLPAALDAAPPELALDLADAAARRDAALAPALDAWAAERVARQGAAFARPALRYLERRVVSGAAAPAPMPGLFAPDAARAPPPKLAPEAAARVLRALNAYATLGGASDLAPDVARALAAAQRAYPGADALLAAAAAPPVAGSGAGAGPGPFPADVEAEANTYFQMVYSESRPAAETVDQMLRFKAGGAPRALQVFACMVHNLIDEFRFFPNYPDKELSVTSQLYGRSLAAGLFAGPDLGAALHCVAQGLAAAPDSKLFQFAVGALRLCAGELERWPAFVLNVAPHAARVRAVDAQLGAELERRAAAAAAAQQRAAAADAAEAAAQANGSSSSGGGAGDDGGAAGVGGAGGKAAAGRKPGDGAGSHPLASINESVGGGGSGTGEALNKLLQSNVAQAAALSTLNDKPAPVSLAGTLNNETLESAERRLRDVRAPPDGVADKVSFIMNNLSKQNLAARAKELAALVLGPGGGSGSGGGAAAGGEGGGSGGEGASSNSGGYVDWFANYLTVKRAAQEPNHHLLYVELLDALADRALSKAVLRTTYYYAAALLESDRAITQTNERTLIKQLGTWLGLQTFARNRPVLAVDMDLKAMVRDAYQRGRMIAVLPFVQKVLEGCKGSKVFRATNPMVHGILALLAEVHAMERLKLNISFVIEMTFKTFEARLEDVLPSRALRDLPRQTLHNPDFSALPDAGKLGGGAGGAGAPLVAPGGPPPSLVPPAGGMGGPPGAGPQQPPGAPDASPGKGGLVPPGAAAAAAAAAGGAPGGGPGGAAAGGPPGALASMAAADPALFAKLHAFVAISPSLAAVAERLQLKRVVPVAVDRAIVEVMPPVVERSVTIACMTAYELAAKDFATDPDENRLRGAAHLMASSLAGSLALVTCKEPLRASLANQLRALLQGQIEAHLLEGALQVR